MYVNLCLNGERKIHNMKISAAFDMKLCQYTYSVFENGGQAG